QALSYYRQAIENDPTNVESYEKALEIKPDDAELYLGLGNAFVAKGEEKKAVIAFQKAIVINPDLDRAHYQLSTMYQELDSQWHNYYEKGNKLQLESQLEKAVIAYYQAILRNPHHSWSYHNLGDTHLKLGNWEEATIAYKKAIRLNPDYFWSNYNLGVAYSNSEQWHLAVQLYLKSIKLNPGLNLPYFTLKETLNKQWYSTIQKADILLKQGDRKSANNIYKKAIQEYQAFLPIEYFNFPKEIPTEPSILLVVDDFLPQCLRYRVHQKIEHLEAAGFSVKFIPQTEIQKAKNIIHFCHVVIFYRVPAFPEIIETIKYAKAIKKVVFYEIDDLIFDPEEYPDSFDSYAGQITHDEYEGLCRGTILFEEAMALCDYGITSTPALAQEMEKIISTKTIFIHRNALDSHNSEFLKVGIPKIKRDYISIFYGTGTKAHNSDFNELAAPAIAQILENYPQIRLTVVGYLTLPEVLLSYQDRIDQVEVIRDIRVYWDFLQQADINIAVLHSTKVNNCKSELKWFEAALLGVPSVVSATQTYLEVVEHGVDGLIAKTTEEWYENLERLVTNEQLRSSLAEAAYQKTVKNYSVPVMAKNIQQIIMTGIEQEIEKGNLVRRCSTKQKLLIVNVFYPPQSIGGGTRVVRDNVDIFMEKYRDKYEVQVFTSDNDNSVPYQITEYTYKNVHVTKVSTPMQEGMDWQYKNPEMYDIFAQYLEFNQPDLIHFHCVQRLTASVLEAAANLNIPYLVTIHDAWWISDHQFLVNEEGLECNYQQNDPLVVTRDTTNLTESISRRHYLRQRLNEANIVLAVSETFAELYRRNGFPQTRSNRNGIMPRPKLPRQPSKTGRVRLAHVGGMAAHKGYFLLKQAVESTSLSSLEFIVVNHAQAGGTISEEYWGTTPVKFINKIPQEKMPEFYSTVDILAAPSIWPESYGLVAREAFAAGVWVIVSNKGALAEDLIPGVHGD
ncbi:MAG: tetratricopeptide repeat protein, partial [Trichodesmium sp. St18_bin1]|nr:tetratricopeptide repeat protein [Trichodesmium sp. St18_bin1]